jgi:hypothetical protein
MPEELESETTESLEKELESLVGEARWSQQHSEAFKERSDEMFQRFIQGNPMYLPVLNGHLLVEDLLNQILTQSLCNPDCLRDGFSFADRLSILQSVSPLPGSSPIWKLLAKLNTLRNAVAHGKDHKRLTQLLRDVQQLIRESNFRIENEEDNPGAIMTYAFGAATSTLDYMLEKTRLRNRVQKFWKKLEPGHPLSLQTIGLMRLVDELAGSDLLG